MTGKQKALKALAILAAVIALCMFFSRTVQTITTPKVQRVSPTKGKLEDKIPLSAQVYFPQAEEVVIDGAAELHLTVSQVKVKVGAQVKKGDVIFTATAPDYESKRKELQDNYDKKVRELALEHAAHIRLNSTSAQNDAFNAMMKAYDAYYAAHYQARLDAQAAGYTLPTDETTWAELPNAPANVQQSAAACAAARQAMDESSQALRGFYTKGGRIGDTTFQYIQKLDGFREEIDDYAAQLLALDLLHQSLVTITAPHDGYITEMALKQGDSYEGAKAAYVISAADCQPALRADISKVTKTLKEDAKVTLDNGATTKVTSLETAADGTKYALIELNKDVLKAGGGLTTMMTETDISLTVTYKAAKNTTLIPASALRQDNDNSYYVYVVSQRYGGGLLDSSGYTLQKTSVTVLEKTDKMVSIGEDLLWTEIADREDRALSDGQAVMDYVD